MIVYVSIGNSDNKLTQEEWVNFIDAVENAVDRQAGQVHGRWFSAPDSAFQNFCICFELIPALAEDMIRRMGYLRERYRQDSIAWAVAETTFIS